MTTDRQINSITIGYVQDRVAALKAKSKQAEERLRIAITLSQGECEEQVMELVRKHTSPLWALISDLSEELELAEDELNDKKDAAAAKERGR